MWRWRKAMQKTADDRGEAAVVFLGVASALCLLKARESYLGSSEALERRGPKAHEK
jgi:hypothetical protein